MRTQCRKNISWLALVLYFVISQATYQEIAAQSQFINSSYAKQLKKRELVCRF